MMAQELFFSATPRAARISESDTGVWVSTDGALFRQRTYVKPITHERPHPGDSGSAPALPKERSPEKDRSGDAPEPPGE